MGFDEFLEQQDFSIECPICLEIIEGAMRMRTHSGRCSHIICSECLDRIMASTDRRCPLCRDEILETYPDRVTDNMIKLARDMYVEKQNAENTLAGVVNELEAARKEHDRMRVSVASTVKEKEEANIRLEAAENAAEQAALAKRNLEIQLAEYENHHQLLQLQEEIARVEKKRMYSENARMNVRIKENLIHHSNQPSRRPSSPGSFITQGAQLVMGGFSSLVASSGSDSRGYLVLSNLNIRVLRSGGREGINIVQHKDTATKELLAIQSSTRDRNGLALMYYDKVKSSTLPTLVGVCRLAGTIPSIVFDMGNDPLYTLEQVLKTSELTPKQLCYVSTQLYCTVAQAHNAGLGFIRFSPSQIFVTKNWHVYMASCDMVSVVGTVKAALVDMDGAYVSPELLCGRVITPEGIQQSNVWGLGCMLAEMMLRRKGGPLFKGRDGQQILECMAQVKEVANSVGDLAVYEPKALVLTRAKKSWSLMEALEQKGVPSEGRALVKGMLCVDPQHRLQAVDFVNIGYRSARSNPDSLLLKCQSNVSPDTFANPKAFLDEACKGW